MHRLAVVALALLAASCGRRTIRDHLTAPVRVVSSNADLLVLANGKERLVPGIEELLTACPSIADGVETGRDGSLFSIVPIFHWCGNDPIGAHFEKVPLEQFITFVRNENPRGGMAVCFDRGGRLDVGVFAQFLRASGLDWDRDAEIVFPGE